MRRIAFVYPGQGSQKCRMGRDFYENSDAARQMMDEADRALDFDLKRVCFEENDLLDLTEYTQPAMVAVCLTITRELNRRGLIPDITAGLSLGEYAAVAAAGGIGDLEAILLVRQRGLLMSSAMPAGEGAMCAVLGMSQETVEQITERLPDVTIANYNCPGQIVITGRRSAVQEAQLQLQEAGARRLVPLNVSGAFHSPFMVSAGEKLRESLQKISFHPLKVPYVPNVTAQVIFDSSQIADMFCRGISSPVRWQQSVENMLQNRVNTFVEIGPGKSLSGFIRKISRDAAVYNVSCWEDLKKVEEII